MLPRHKVNWKSWVGRLSYSDVRNKINWSGSKVYRLRKLFDSWKIFIEKLQRQYAEQLRRKTKELARKSLKVSRINVISKTFHRLNKQIDPWRRTYTKAAFYKWSWSTKYSLRWFNQNYWRHLKKSNQSSWYVAVRSNA